MTLCQEDGAIVGNTALDAVGKVAERHVSAELLLVRVELVVEGGEGIEHVVCESRGYSSRTGVDAANSSSTTRRLRQLRGRGRDT